MATATRREDAKRWHFRAYTRCLTSKPFLDTLAQAQADARCFVACLRYFVLIYSGNTGGRE